MSLNTQKYSNNLSMAEHNVSVGTRGTWTHEVGHKFWYEQMTVSERNEFSRVAAKYVTGGRAGSYHPISTYAGTNDKEVWAEAFCAYLHPDYTRRLLPADIEAQMDKFVGREGLL